MAKEREFTLNDLTAESLANAGQWDALERFIAQRAKVYPDRYVDDSPASANPMDTSTGVILPNDQSLPLHEEVTVAKSAPPHEILGEPVEEVVTVSPSASEPHQGEKTDRTLESIAKREKRTKVAQAFLRGYIGGTFTHEELKGGGLRIVNNSRVPERRRTFTTIMRNFGRVTEAPTHVRADLNPRMRESLRVPLSEIFQDKATLTALFLGIWTAKGHPTQMRLSDVNATAYMATRLEEEYGFPMVKLDESEAPGTLAIRYRNRRTIPALSQTEYVRDLPFLEAILPVPSQPTVRNKSR